MADEDAHSLWDRWFVDRMDSLGFQVSGEGREKTRRNNMWTNDRREGWETEAEQQDRVWVRTSREASGKKREGLRQVIVGICSAVGGAALLYILAHMGMK